MKNLAIVGALEIETTVFSDERGEFEVNWETCNQVFESLDFTPTNMHHAYNTCAGTMRGLHYQIRPFQQAKLISCVAGSVWDVIVDIRPESPSYGKWHATHLVAKSGKSVFAPGGCAHGYVSLHAGSVVSYLIDSDYEPKAARVLRWNDPVIAIAWPDEHMKMSEKDATAKGMEECEY